MIPKVIHYCWFGSSPKSDLIQMCIESWKKYCPDYEIIEWNEENFDINSNAYVKEAYEAKKWAFVSDYVRLWVIYHYGGIYLDTDVELLKSMDSFRKDEAFFAFENDTYIATGLGFGAEQGHPVIKVLLDDYSNVHFRTESGFYDETPCPVRNTNVLLKLGLQPDNTYQTVSGAVVYPKEYFCPKNGEGGELFLTEKTVAIHHYNASWYSDNQRKRTEKYRELVQKYGTKKANRKMLKYNTCYFLKTRGLRYCLEKFCEKVFHR